VVVGEDEDFVIVMPVNIYENDAYADYLVERLSVCDYEQHEINENGQRLYVFITAHA
jgi:hypothetical protein